MNKDEVLRRDLEQGRGHVRVRRKRGGGERREVEDVTAGLNAKDALEKSCLTGLASATSTFAKDRSGAGGVSARWRVEDRTELAAECEVVSGESREGHGAALE